MYWYVLFGGIGPGAHVDRRWPGHIRPARPKNQRTLLAAAVLPFVDPAAGGEWGMGLS